MKAVEHSYFVSGFLLVYIYIDVTAIPDNELPFDCIYCAFCRKVIYKEIYYMGDYMCNRGHQIRCNDLTVTYVPVHFFRHITLFLFFWHAETKIGVICHGRSVLASMVCALLEGPMLTSTPFFYIYIYIYTSVLGRRCPDRFHDTQRLEK